jgi:hypothetical protein
VCAVTTRSRDVANRDRREARGNDGVVAGITEDGLKQIEDDLIVVEDQDRCHSTP